MTVHKVKVRTSSNWEKICISTVFLLQTFHFFPNLKAIFMIYKYLRRGDYSLGGGRHFSGSNYSAFTKKSNGPTILVTINQCSIRVPPLSTKFQQETMIRYQIRSTCRGGYTGGGALYPSATFASCFSMERFPASVSLKIISWIVLPLIAITKLDRKKSYQSVFSDWKPWNQNKVEKKHHFSTLGACQIAIFHF